MSSENTASSSNDDSHVNRELHFKLISRFPLFANLSEDSRKSLAGLMTEVRFKAGEQIVVEGDFVDSFFFIMSGKAEVLKKNMINGEEANVILATLAENDAIGIAESGFFSPHGRRTATVVALTDCLLLKLDVITFNQFLEAHPQFDTSIKKMAGLILKMDFIKQTSPFSHLSNESIYELSEKIKEIHFPANTVIFNKGDIADCCYLLRTGNVEIFVSDINGQERSLATIEPPELLGEAALLTQDVRNASARTLTDCSLLMLDRELLFELIKSNESFYASMTGFMVKRFYPTHDKNVVVYQHTTKDGQERKMLHNTKIHQYFHLTNESWFIWQQLDGTQTIQDITFLFLKKYGIFAPDMICNLLYSWAEIGFIQLPVIKTIYSEEAEPKTFLGKLKNKINRITQFDYSYTHTDNWLSKVYNKGIFLFFTWPVLIFFIGLIAYGFYNFIQNYGHVTDNFRNIPPLGWFALILIFPVSFVVVVLHELGHAFTAKKFGHKIQRFGIGWYGFSPIAYTDTSELWVAEQIPRIAVDIAGVAVELIIAGTLAIIANQIANFHVAIFLWIFSLTIYYNAFKNLSPVREFDGYSLIMNILDFPRLRKISIDWLVNSLPGTYKEPGVLKEHKPEVIYALVCIAYILTSTLILFLIFQFFFKIFAINNVLGIPSTFFSLLLALCLLVLTMLSIWQELKKYRDS